MKNGLIKITDTDNLYYDSNTKQYKSRMHCPYCGKPSGCYCYKDFDSVPLFEEEFPNFHCSNRCFVLDARSECGDIAEALCITIKPTMEEWNASKIVKVFMEDFEGDADIPSGDMCEI